MVDEIRVSESQPRNFPSLCAPNRPKSGSGDRVGADIAPHVEGKRDIGNPSKEKVPSRDPRRREGARPGKELIGRCEGGLDPSDKVEGSPNFSRGLGGDDSVPQEAIGRSTVG